jgi:hypothetical protein
MSATQPLTFDRWGAIALLLFVVVGSAAFTRALPEPVDGSSLDRDRGQGLGRREKPSAFGLYKSE